MGISWEFTGDRTFVNVCLFKWYLRFECFPVFPSDDMANGMDDYHVSFGVYSQGARVAEEHLVVDLPSHPALFKVIFLLQVGI